MRTRQFLSFSFTVSVWRRCLAGGRRAISRDIQQGATLCWLRVSGTITQEHYPDGVGGVVTTPQPLFGLAELSKSRIWPQHNARTHKFVKRNKEKVQQLMRFVGSQQSLHNSSHPETSCTTLHVFFPLLRVCYLFIPSLLLSFISSNTFHSLVFPQHVEFPDVCPWETSVIDTLEVRWRSSLPTTTNRSGFTVVPFAPFVNTNAHCKKELKPVHVQFSSVTKSNQLCHPRHKS